MFQKIKNTCIELTQKFDEIPSERKQLLGKISSYIQSKKDKNEPIQMMYVCTHNSRRSHFGQIWALVASEFYTIGNVSTFSGGTEATAFNINAINALKEIGFEIQTKSESSNPVFEVKFSNEKNPSICFSKVYDYAFNPTSNFAAIMTCGDAEENCPFIPGVDLRIATTYNDPKEFDGTPVQDEKYKERSLQIALETLYIFSLIK
jgi:protein-tyrosine phosphatase/arsenate reductase